jgi:hypothetical protein
MRGSVHESDHRTEAGPPSRDHLGRVLVLGRACMLARTLLSACDDDPHLTVRDRDGREADPEAAEVLADQTLTRYDAGELRLARDDQDTVAYVVSERTKSPSRHGLEPRPSPAATSLSDRLTVDATELCTSCYSGQVLTYVIRSVATMNTSHSTASTAPGAPASAPRPAQERDDLVDVLRKHRSLFRFTVAGLTDEQARLTPTVSSLSLGGLIKHVTAVEVQWASFVVNGPTPSPDIDWASIDWTNPPPEVQQYADGFRMLEDETLAGLLARYDEVAASTDELVRSVDLDAAQRLPKAPWFEPGSWWSARRVFTHILAETAQHAGHADIIRETIDGQKSMG